MIVNQRICRRCNSVNIVKNGHTNAGKQKYFCNACHGGRTLDTKQYYSEPEKDKIIQAYNERMSLRGTSRIFGVAVSTILRWLKKKHSQ